MAREPHAEHAMPPLALVLHDGAFERVHYALVMASAACALGRPVMLFVTGRALHAFRRPKPGGVPSWVGLTSRDGSETAVGIDDGHGRRGLGRFEELLAATAELEARFIACEMGLRGEDLAISDLRPDIPFEVAGIVTLYNWAGPAGQIIFI